MQFSLKTGNELLSIFLLGAFCALITKKVNKKTDGLKMSVKIYNNVRKQYEM